MLNNRPLWWRQPIVSPATGPAKRLVVVTDIDASLLEAGTRSLHDERAALDFLTARGIPLVINSSRTRAEIERLHKTLRLQTPFISEQGSALFVPHGSLPLVPSYAHPAVGGGVIEFGRRYYEVVETLRLTSRELEVDIVGFAELTIEGVARELGVPIVEAQLAKVREYTELFRIVGETETRRRRLVKALGRRGLRCVRVGAHHLVTAAPDRAASLWALKAMWTEVWDEPLIIGLADSEDDIAWVRHADVAIFVQREGANVSSRVLSKLPSIHVARSRGRAGWSEAIFECVGSLLQQLGAPDRRFVH
jgi:mannosyl-3-phosphoglycerate phosphatase